MNTHIRNLNNSELRTLATGTGTLAECARRLLAERAEIEDRFEAANRAAHAARSSSTTSR
jgi:hypothetical protein